jgi:hypothetical protein
MKLIVADIDGEEACRPAFKQKLRKAACRGSGIETDPPCRRKAEAGERSFQLEGAAGDILVRFQDAQTLAGPDQHSGLIGDFAADLDLLTPNQILGFRPRRDETPAYQKLIQPRFNSKLHLSPRPLNMYVAKLFNYAIIDPAVLRHSQSKRDIPNPQKDVEQTHVRDDSLLRGRGR